MLWCWVFSRVMFFCNICRFIASYNIAHGVSTCIKHDLSNVMVSFCQSTCLSFHYLDQYYITRYQYHHERLSKCVNSRTVIKEFADGFEKLIQLPDDNNRPCGNSFKRSPSWPTKTRTLRCVLDAELSCSRDDTYDHFSAFFLVTPNTHDKSLRWPIQERRTTKMQEAFLRLPKEPHSRRLWKSKSHVRCAHSLHINVHLVNTPPYKLTKR